MLDGLTPGAKDILIRADLNGETADYAVTLPAYMPDTGTSKEGNQAERVAVVPLKEALSALGTTTQLPYSGQYELGSEAVLYEAENGSQACGTLVQLDFWGSGDADIDAAGIDTQICVYRQQGDDVVLVGPLDRNGRGLVESIRYQATEAGTYYFAFLGLSAQEYGWCHCEITAYEQSPDSKLQTLDFTLDPVPEPEIFGIRMRPH